MQNREYISFLLFLTIFSSVTHREIQTVGLPSRTVVDRLAQLICNQSQVGTCRQRPIKINQWLSPTNQNSAIASQRPIKIQQWFQATNQNLRLNFCIPQAVFRKR